MTLHAGRRNGVDRRAFTLIEVLVVIAIIAIFAALMLPALDRSTARSKRIACINHLKQLGLCWHMYASDNNGWLVENLPAPRGSNSWVTGNLRNSYDATNTALLRQGKFFPYASQTAIYRCPCDAAQTRGVPHVRSYAMNSWMGSRHMENYSNRSGYRTFVRDTETAAAGPARLWVLMDEHVTTIDDGWFLVTMDDSRPFASIPGARHQQGYALNFADGHAEVYKMRDKLDQSGTASPKNSDWLRLKQVTTMR